MANEESEPNTAPQQPQSEPAQNEPQPQSTPQAQPQQQPQAQPQQQPQAQPQQQPQAQPQQPQQPPQPQIVIPPAQSQVPPANAQEVIARQQADLAQQQAWAQARDRQQFGPVAEGLQAAPAPVMGGVFQQAAAQQQAPPQGVNLPGSLSAVQVAQGNPQQQLVQQPQPQPQVQPQPQPQPQIQIQPQITPQQNPFAGGLTGIPNPAIAQGPNAVAQAMIAAGIPDPAIAQNGVTIAQLNQQAHIQGAPPPSYAYPQGQQPQAPSSKPTVRWHPGRNSKTVIEFHDSILSDLPDGVEQETDPQAKVVAVLLMEILSQRDRISALEQALMQGGAGSPDLEARLYRLEQTLYQQTQSLNQGAQAYREDQQRLAAEQNAGDPQTPANPPDSSR